MTFFRTVTVESAADASRTPVTGADLLRAGLPLHVAIGSERYDNLDVLLDQDAGVFWTRMAQQGRPMCSAALLDDMVALQARMRDWFAAAAVVGQPKPFSYFVLGSSVPGIYNLGGDLELFADFVRAGDREGIRSYGHTCVDLVYESSRAFDLPIVTVALVQGDALGGGFEIALSADMVVAERSAKFGLPEILFGLFPGMGAYSFLSRKIGPAKAKEMVLGGRIHTAEELHALGVVDVLAEDGQGEAAVYDHVRRMGPKHNAERAFYATRRRVDPVTREELRDVVDTWTETVLELNEHDLRKMLRLVAAQDRRLGRTARPPAVAAE